MIHLGDITKIDGHIVPTTDCVVGGSPCQDLSVAGLRKGLQHDALGNDETTRSGLFMDQIRLVKEMRDADRSVGRTGIDIRPRYMLWENVPGAFSSNSGEDFRVVLEEVVRIAEEGVTIPRPAKGKWTNSGVIVGDGYSVAWRVFDAQHWGVPQRRRRICLLADFNGHSAAEIVFNADKQHRSSDRATDNASFINLGTESGCEVQPVSKGLSGDSQQGKQERQEVTEDVRGSIESSYPAFTYQDREGKPGGGKGGLIQEDKATSLRTNNYMTVFQPVVSLEGNGQRPSCSDSHGTPHAVIYDSRGNGDGNTSCNLTSRDESSLGDFSNVVIQSFKGDGDINGDVSGCLTGDHQNMITDLTSIVVSMDREAFNAGSEFNKAMTIHEDGIQPTLVARGPGAICYCESMGHDIRSTKFAKDHVPDPLTATDYKEPGIVCYAEGVDLYNQTLTGDVSKSINTGSDSDHIPCVAYWDGTQTAGTLTANNANGGQRMPDKDNFNCVIARYPNLQETTGSLMASGYDKLGTQEDSNGMYVVARENIRYIVRRLTPLECERLQGFPDGWTDIGEWTDEKGKVHKPADSCRYKALGNSIALPSWRWIMKRISSQYERPATLASLFDGIGGFPLIWEQINGKGTCLWASEIEEFPIAVTKERFSYGRR